MREEQKRPAGAALDQAVSRCAEALESRFRPRTALCRLQQRSASSLLDQRTLML
jgi:hypothetical protein